MKIQMRPPVLMMESKTLTPLTAESLFNLAPRSIILSQSLYPSNIGAAARAVGNMGFDRLVLVNPQCEVDFSAHQAAASTQKPLEDRTVYNSWDNFFAQEGEGVLIGLCPRSGKKRQVQPLEEALEELLTLDLLRRPWYFAFGREDNGFSAQEIQPMNRICELPTYSEFKSLNLAQATLLTMFVFRQSLGKFVERIEAQLQQYDESTNGDLLNPLFHYSPDMANEINADLKPRYFPEKTIQQWIENLGFVLDDHKVNASEVIKKLILRGVPSPKELHILECILHQDIRKLKEYQNYYQTVIKGKASLRP